VTAKMVYRISSWVVFLCAVFLVY